MEEVLAQSSLLAGINEMAGLSPNDQFAVIAASLKELAKPKSKGSREDFFKYQAYLEESVIKKVNNGKLQVVDFEIVSVVQVTPGVSKKLIRFFESETIRKVGLQTLNNGRTEKDFNMIVSQVGFLATTAAGTTDADALAALYQGVNLIPSLRNGFLKLSVNDRIIFKDKPINSFYSIESGKSDNEKGYIKLDNPKFILSDEPVDCEIEMFDATSVPANTFAMLKIRGAATIAK